jgi:hypothetical protein
LFDKIRHHIAEFGWLTRFGEIRLRATLQREFVIGSVGCSGVKENRRGLIKRSDLLTQIHA